MGQPQPPLDPQEDLQSVADGGPAPASGAPAQARRRVQSCGGSLGSRERAAPQHFGQLVDPPGAFLLLGGAAR
eukprot:6965393-Alexandrium_andersonii.AAC.1